MRALHLSGELRIDGSEILESIGILTTAFGADWLNEAAGEQPPTVLPAARAPIGNLIQSAGVKQIAELIEIARYLRQFAHDPNLGQVVAGLKASYDQTLLQLAFASRLGKLEIGTVVLEPPAVAGKLSDIRLIVDSKALRIECYRPEPGASSSVNEEAVRLGKDVLEYVHDAPIVISVAIALKRRLDARIRKEACRIAKDLVNQVIAQARFLKDNELFPTLVCHHREIGAISVCRSLPSNSGEVPRLVVAESFPKQDKDFDHFARTSWVRLGDLRGVQTEIPSTVASNHFAIWLDEETRANDSIDRDLTEDLAKLGRKIEKKLSQTRSMAGDARLVLVETWMTGQLHRVAGADLERLRRKIVCGHAGVSGLVLAQRSWNHNLKRHGYEFRLLEPDMRDDLVARVLSDIQSREEQT